MVGLEDSPSWLETDVLLAQFSIQAAEAAGAASPWDRPRGQIDLGDEAFVKRMRASIATVQTDVNVPKQRLRPPAPSSQIIEVPWTVLDQPNDRNGPITVVTSALSNRPQ